MLLFKPTTADTANYGISDTERKRRLDKRSQSQLDAHLSGRWEIDGDRLRYDACSAIPKAALQILKEFRADMDTRWFYGEHDDETRIILDALIAWGDLIESGLRDYRDDLWNDVAHWQHWLRALTRELDRFWD